MFRCLYPAKTICCLIDAFGLSACAGQYPDEGYTDAFVQNILENTDDAKTLDNTYHILDDNLGVVFTHSASYGSDTNLKCTEYVVWHDDMADPFAGAPKYGRQACVFK